MKKMLMAVAAAAGFCALSHAGIDTAYYATHTFITVNATDTARYTIPLSYGHSFHEITFLNIHNSNTHDIYVRIDGSDNMVAVNGDAHPEGIPILRGDFSGRSFHIYPDGGTFFFRGDFGASTQTLRVITIRKNTR
jgi:hypothetical protein